MTAILFFDQIPAVIREQLSAKKLEGHPIAVMRSFGQDVVPRGQEGNFPYLVIRSPTNNLYLESSEASYYRVSLTFDIYDRDPDELQTYGNYLKDALKPVIENVAAFTEEMPEGTSLTAAGPGATRSRRLGDGLYSLEWTVPFSGRVLRTD